MRSLMRDVRSEVLQALPLRLAVVNLEFRKYHGRFPRLSPPQTFNEKITHRKLYDRDPRMPLLSDKILAKCHVSDILGEEWVTPATLWSGEKLPPKSERNWPMPYAMKASHGCGWNIFVQSPEDEDWDRIERRVGKWLKRIYGQRGREWLYSQIQPGVLVEPFIGESDQSPADYKFFVFGGRTELIQVDLARFGAHRQFFYDRDWKRQPFTYVCPHEAEEIEPPASLAEMIAAADRLGESFNFVRIDLYEVSGRPRFGEFTFYPNGGRYEFKPENVEEELGRLWVDTV